MWRFLISCTSSPIADECVGGVQSRLQAEAPAPFSLTCFLDKEQHEGHPRAAAFKIGSRLQGLEQQTRTSWKN